MGNILGILRSLWSNGKATPSHLAKGEVGERAAEAMLVGKGMKLLGRNFSTRSGEIDLILRDGDNLVFVEVKARSRSTWTRPAAAVNAPKRRRLTKTALAYMRRIKHPACVIRFDIVEVYLDDEGSAMKIVHLPNAFPMEGGHFYRP